jgi:hypothetical protein
MNDVLSSATLPKLFKRAKVIAIPKLSTYFIAECDVQVILERMIFLRIQPPIEGATQAGFRKHCSCTQGRIGSPNFGGIFSSTLTTSR